MTLQELPLAKEAFEKTNQAQVKMAHDFEGALPGYEDELAKKVKDAIEHGAFSVCCELEFLNERHRNKFLSYVRDNFDYNCFVPHNVGMNPNKVIHISWEHF